MARVRRGAQTWANVPPRGHPPSLRGRETVLSVRQKARRRPISAKVREGYVLAPKAAAAAELPSAETARRRRPKLTRSSRQRPPHLAPAFPGSARFRHLPLGGARWGGGCEVWKERRARGGEDARDEAEVRRVIAPRSPSPHPSPPPVRPPPAPGYRRRLPGRGHRSAPPRGGCPREANSVTGEVPRALGYPLSSLSSLGPGGQERIPKGVPRAGLQRCR